MNQKEYVARLRVQQRAEGEADLAGRLVTAVGLLRTARRALRRHDLEGLSAALSDLHTLAARASIRAFLVRTEGADAEAP